MAFYLYKAKNLDGEIIDGKCYCTSLENLSTSLRDKGFYLLQYKETGVNSRKLLNRKTSSRDLSVLCSHFSSLISAGINISEILLIIYNQSLNKDIKNSLYEIRETIQQGDVLSYCMRKYDNVYPEFLVNMIKIGEESGKLDTVFDMMCRFYCNEDKIRSKIVKSMLYPVIVLIVSIFIMEYMILNIIPVFTSTLESLNASVPSSTRIIVCAGRFINNNILYFIVLIISVFLILKHFNKLESIKRYFYIFLIHNRLTKNLYKKIIAIRFARCMGILLDSGVQIITSFEICLGVIGNEYAKNNIRNCLEKIKTGSDISESMHNSDIFPDFLYTMVRTGEEAGKLQENLLKASDIMEGELYNYIDKITLLIEPALIIFIALIIGFMLTSILIPMINIMDAI